MKRIWLVVFLLVALLGCVVYVSAGQWDGSPKLVYVPCTVGEVVAHDGEIYACVGGAEELARLRTDCEMQMEAAMRAKDALDAHDERLYPKSNIAFSDGSTVIDWGWHGMNDMAVITIPDTRTEEQRLDDEERSLQRRREELVEQRKRDAERERLKAENAAMHKAVTEQWASVKKACWVQP